MKRKLVSILLMAAMTLSLLVGCGGTTEPKEVSEEKAPGQETSVLKDGKNTTLTIVFPGNSSAPASKEEVTAAINEIVQKTIDGTVELNILEWGVYSEQQNLMLSSGEPIDLILMAGTVQNSINSGQIMDITDLYSEYGKDAQKLMGQYIDACYVGGKLYGLPTYHEFAHQVGIVGLTDVVDQVGVDPTTVKTWDDADALLGKIKAANPNMDVLIPAETSKGILQHCGIADFDVLLSEMIGVYADGRDGLKVHSIAATDTFKEVADMAYEWNQKGYFIADSTTITDTRQTFLKAGSAFGYIGVVHPGTPTQESVNAGKSITTMPIGDAVCGTGNVSGIQYAIPSATDSPEKSMALLNLIYSNPEIQNLLRFGIEGTDYVMKADGVAGYPDGIDNTTVGWSNEPWITGNASIGYSWETDPENIWDEYKKFNDGATFSPAYGFTYDSSNVKTEVTAVQNVVNKYLALIYSGLTDPEETVAAYNKDLEAAGMQKIVDDAQAQLDAWSANK